MPIYGEAKEKTVSQTGESNATLGNISLIFFSFWYELSLSGVVLFLIPWQTRSPVFGSFQHMSAWMDKNRDSLKLPVFSLARQKSTLVWNRGISTEQPKPYASSFSRVY